MFKKKKLNIFKRIFINQVVIFILGLIIISAVSFPLVKNFNKQHEINKEIKNLEEQVSLLEGKNIELNEILSYFESDQFVDEQARLNLNYKKEGETVVVIKDKNKIINNIDNNNLSLYQDGGLNKKIPAVRISNADRWWLYFFN